MVFVPWFFGNSILPANVRSDMDVHTPEQRRRNMQAIRSKETKMEVRLAKEVWKKGLRYRKNNPKVFGKPDLTFRKLKVAVFVDSEYFHGKDWETQKFRIKSNRDFWWPKIEQNIARDRAVEKRLLDEGWMVLRFWSLEVKNNLDSCVSKIEAAITARKNAS